MFKYLGSSILLNICLCFIINFFSKVEIQDKCHLCSKHIPGDDVLSKAASQVNIPVNFIKTNYMIICPTCAGEYLQYQRLVNREKNYYLSICKLVNYTNMHGINLSSCHPTCIYYYSNKE